MNSKVLGTVAVAGAVATFALLNVNGPVAGSNFLSATAISDSERTFINFISEYHRTYGTKEEYAYRLAIFEENLKSYKSMVDDVYSVAMGADLQFDQLLDEDFVEVINSTSANKLKDGWSSIKDFIDFFLYVIYVIHYFL